MANWYVRSGAGGSASGADWANAKLTLAAAFTASAAGDTIYVSEDHAESQASTLTLTSKGTNAAPQYVICVDHAGSVPPVSADLRTTASIRTTGNISITIASSVTGVCYYYGIIFTAGNSTGTANFTLGTNSAVTVFEACKFVFGGTGSGSNLNVNTTANVVLINTTIKFGNVGQRLQGIGVLVWKNTSSLVDTGGTIPDSFIIGQNAAISFLFEGCDLSGLNGKTLVNAGAAGWGTIHLKDCKLPSSLTPLAGSFIINVYEVLYTRCDSGGTNYKTEKHNGNGDLTTATDIIRTSGASDGTTGVSWKIVTTAANSPPVPFQALPIAIWNDTTGSNVTITIEGLQDPRTSTSLPNNNDVWFEVEHLGASGSPQGSFKSGTKADLLAGASALTASTQAWDSQVTARANSTAYSLGDARKVATNSGRVFICTTAGTSAGSEPGGYASAVDGGAVTDGSAVFTAAVRFKQAITLSSPQPAQKGALYAYPKIGKASAIYNIDPLIALS